MSGREKEAEERTEHEKVDRNVDKSNNADTIRTVSCDASFSVSGALLVAL